MARVELRPDLDLLIARMIAPKINEIAHAVVAPKAKALAPPTKEWVNSGDDHVRAPHVSAGGQVVADNVRFELTAFEWDVKNPGRSHGAPVKAGDGSGWDGPRARTIPGVNSYLIEPRDATGGHYVQIVNCRCQAIRDPEGISRLVKVNDAVPTGTRVRATVYVSGKLAQQAEHGDIYPFPVAIPVAKGTRFMHRAVSAAANELRARR